MFAGTRETAFIQALITISVTLQVSKYCGGKSMMCECTVTNVTDNSAAVMTNPQNRWAMESLDRLKDNVANEQDPLKRQNSEQILFGGMKTGSPMMHPGEKVQCGNSLGYARQFISDFENYLIEDKRNRTSR